MRSLSKLFAAAALAIVLGASRPAAACGVYPFGEMLADVAKGLAGTTTKISTPLLVIGAAKTTHDGSMAAVDIGYGWGEKQTGGIFPGTSISRVLVGIHTDGESSLVRATYGWYTNGLGSLGFDFGAQGTTSTSDMSGTRGLGPTARLTVGIRGVGLRLAGGALFGDESRLTGSAELVVDVMDLGGAL